MQLIVIAGQAGVGKTTLAHYIACNAFNLGMIPKIMSFAGPLKKEAAEKGYGKEENPKAYREYCQTMGLMKREVNPDYWVNKFEEELEELSVEETQDLKDGKKFWERCVVIDDCRFMNELLLGKKWNGRLIFLSYGDRDIPDADAEWREHESEDLANSVAAGDEDTRELFTHILINEGTMSDLAEKARMMTPIWVGAATEEVPEGDKTPLSKYIEELIDLLLIEQLEYDRPEDEEEEDSD
mgnify:CR=1 FL=1